MVCGPSWNDLWKEVEVIADSFSSVIPVPLNQLKKQCRVPIDITDEDSLLFAYAKAAEKLLETACETTLKEKTLNLNLARWPAYTDYLQLRLEFPPIVEFVHLKYYDTTDTQVTFDPDLIETWFQRGPPSLLIRSSDVPSLSTLRSKVVEVQVKAGYATIPQNAELAILELVAFWYLNREAYGRLPSLADGAQGRVFQSLIDSLRWRVYP